MNALFGPLRRLTWLLPLLLLTACATEAPVRLYPDVTPPRAEAIQVVRKADHPVVALALGSGGVRGFAHIAVIKVLEANQIPVDIVVGTSVGSVVGALYAGGYQAQALEQLALQLDEKQIKDYSWSKRSIYGGERLQDFINESLKNRDIEQLDKPFAAIATELQHGRMMVFNRGNTGLAVRASSSIPGIFEPPAFNGSEYVDGDLKNPIPVSVARSMGADVVIAVDISQRPEDFPDNSDIIDVLKQSIRIMRQSILADEIKEATVVIRPTVRATSLDFDQELKQRMFQAGEEAAAAALPHIQEALRQAGLRKRPH